MNALKLFYSLFHPLGVIKKFTLWGDSGGGGGGNQSQTQTQIADLPEWAKPTAERTLAKTEALTTDRPFKSFAGQYDKAGNQIGFDVNKVVAGFTPMQQQAFQGASQLQPSAATGMGMGLTGAAGLRALGARYNPYQTGQFGEQAGEYMSPFIQQALEPQMREARRQSEIQRNIDQAQAVGRGAFGGSRQAIVEAERQRNLGTQLGDIQARGLQTAFQQAQDQFNREQQLREQSRQYGAGFGMQGLQTALQSAGQLGQLGGQQFGQAKDVIGLQSQLGTQQQQLEQSRLGAAKQDFEAAQRYPYQQLEFMSNILRGTPMGSVQTMYMPPPNTLGQLAGLGIGLGGMSQAFRGFAEGGSVTSDASVADILDNLSDQQLARARQEALQKNDVNRIELIDQELAQRASLRQGLGGAFNSLPAEQQESVLSAANGGIVAFADEGLVKDKEEATSTAGQLASSVMDFFKSSAQKTAELGRLRGAQQEARPGFFEALTPTERKIREDRLRELKDQERALINAPRAAAATPAPTQAPAVQQADLRRVDEAIAAPAPAPAPTKAPEVKLSRSERTVASKLGNAVAQQTGDKPKDMISAYQEMLQTIKGSGDDERYKELVGLVKGMTKLPEYDRNDALAKFGFAMAAAASRPGARLLSSISAAAPEFIAHREEYDKRAREAQKLGAQMQIELLKYKMAEDKDDRKTAMTAAQNIQNMQLQREKMLQDAAYQKAALGKQSGIMAVYDELRRANPSANTEDLLKRASQISGYSYRTEAAQSSKLQAALNKIEEDYKTLPALKTGSGANSAFVTNMEAERNRRVQEAYRLYGGDQAAPAVSSPMPQGVTVQRLGS